jgi:hypothetical protein
MYKYLVFKVRGSEDAWRIEAAEVDRVREETDRHLDKAGRQAWELVEVSDETFESKTQALRAGQRAVRPSLASRVAILESEVARLTHELGGNEAMAEEAAYVEAVRRLAKAVKAAKEEGGES